MLAKEKWLPEKEWGHSDAGVWHHGMACERDRWVTLSIICKNILRNRTRSCCDTRIVKKRFEWLRKLQICKLLLHL